MNTRKALPITTVLLILALALATVGVGYGLWSKTLHIYGPSTPGSSTPFFQWRRSTSRMTSMTSALRVDTQLEGCDADGSFNDDLEAIDPVTKEPKDIAECVASLDEATPRPCTLSLPTVIRPSTAS